MVCPTFVRSLAASLVLAAGCSADTGGNVVARPGARVDAGGSTARDAVPPDTAPTVHPGPDAGPSRDGGVTAMDAGGVTAMDAGGVTAMDAGGVTAMDVVPPLPDVPWTPPDVPPLDVQGTTLDADTSAHNTTFTLAGAGTDAPGRFTGVTDPSRAPTVVYPADGTIVPPNLPGFEVHFLPGAGNSLFALTFTGDRGTVTVYTGCATVGGGCVTALTAAQFAEVARVAQPGGQVTLGLRATSATGAPGGPVGSAPGRTLGVTSTVLHGGLYYWAAASGSILRYDWDLAGARPEAYLRGDPFNCVGCHVLARDGRRAAVGRFIPGPSQMTTFDVATRRPLSSPFGANFASFSPDDLRVLASDGAHLWVADAASGAVAPGLPGGYVGSMPDWARDGRRAVYSRPATVAPFFGSPGHGAPADLMQMTWAGSGFGPATALVRAHGENNYYPSFSPDGSWVLFDRSAGDSYNVIDAHLWAVPDDSPGGAPGTPVHLAGADGTGDVGNSWPKFAPFAQVYQGETLMWLTFASRRDYGLRLQQQSRTADMRTAQLWMAAFRPGHGAGGGDPSSPAFWLPMQDIRTGNHIAQWSEAVLRAGCTTNADCAPTERCQATNRGMACVGITM